MVKNCISIPFKLSLGFNFNLIGNPEYDWMFSTLPTNFTAGRSIPTPRGRLVGGSSAINGMAWTRASKAEYNAWDELNNFQGGWNWDNLLPYFERVESRLPDPMPDTSGSSPPNHDSSGTRGPITVNFTTPELDPY